MLRRLIIACGVMLALACPALAQGGFGNTTGYVITSCGAPPTPFVAGRPGPFTVDVNGNTCIDGTISASLEGFTPNGNYTTLTATAASSTSTALPAGAVVAFQNTSAVDLSCVLSAGAATATTNKLILRAGATEFFTVGANVNTACINQTGSASNVVVLAGGSGLGTNFGGGGAGGGGGAVTVADGADVTQGSIADAAVAAGATGSVSAKLRSISRDVMTTNTWAGGTLGAMAAYGTSPGAVLVPGANVFVTNTLDPGQAAMAASSPVVLPNNMAAIPLWGHGATGAAVPANAALFGFNSGGNTTAPSTTSPLPVRPGDGTRNAIIDPCEANLQTYAPISITTATTTRIVAPSASNKTYICGLFLTSAAADNIGIVEGTGGTCGTGTAGVVGGTTAANGPNFAANGGMLLQLGGKVAAAQTAGTNVDLCLITSAATPLAGGIKYVQAP